MAPSAPGTPRSAELALGALRAEHDEFVVHVEVGAPLVGRVLILPRRSNALGASQRMLVDGVGHATRLAASWTQLRRVLSSAIWDNDNVWDVLK